MLIELNGKLWSRLFESLIFCVLDSIWWFSFDLLGLSLPT